MFSQIPIYPPYSIPLSKASLPVFPQRVVPVKLSTPVLTTLKLQNQKGIELINNQLKLLTMLSNIEEFKENLPILIANLENLSEEFLKSNKDLQERIDNIKEEPIDEKTMQKVKDYEEKIVVLIGENEKFQTLFEQNEEKNKEKMKKKEEEIENLLKAIQGKDEELKRMSRMNIEKENIEKHIEKLVIVNEDLKKNYEKSVSDRDLYKARCAVLMDINSELRDSLEIVLHENKKLNKVLNSDPKVVKEEEEEN